MVTDFARTHCKNPRCFARLDDAANRLGYCRVCEFAVGAGLRLGIVGVASVAGTIATVVALVWGYAL